MRIGLFGGSFDPIHLGHLILAERCRDAAKLEAVWFLPSYVPPHKQGRTLTRFEHRCDMAGLAIAGQPAFRIEPIEKELPPPNYTLQTVRELQQRHPATQFCLIIGGDSLHEFHTWHEPAELAAAMELIAVPRPNSPVVTAEELAAELQLSPGAVRLTVVPSPLVDISSTQLRAAVAAQESIRFRVPRSVEEFIRERKLYRV